MYEFTLKSGEKFLLNEQMIAKVTKPDRAAAMKKGSPLSPNQRSVVQLVGMPDNVGVMVAEEYEDIVGMVGAKCCPATNIEKGFAV